MDRRIDLGLERQMAEARALLRRGLFGSATRLLLMAHNRDPSRAEVHRLLGLCYARQGKGEEASETLREALRLNPLDFVARGALAVLLNQNGDPSTAIEELEHGMALLQERATELSQDARAKVESGRLPEALAMLRRASWLRLGRAVLNYYLDELYCDHCLLELALRDRPSEQPASGNGSS